MDQAWEVNRRMPKAARQLGHTLASRNLGLVYGGTDVGTMGELANAALEGGGEVIGVVPRIFIEKRISHAAISDLRVVDAMHERKGLMAELSDAFIALPGGLGTIDELFEMVTWTQLGLQRKPCGLLNVVRVLQQVSEFPRLRGFRGIYQGTPSFADTDR